MDELAYETNEHYRSTGSGIGIFLNPVPRRQEGDF
jgi:hypothetical protein